MHIRGATVDDAAPCALVYAPFVTGTAITFEVDPPDEAEMASRIEQACATHAWLVLEDGGRVVGYAYGGPFKARPAYRWTCEVSVYVEPGSHRRGAGRTLYSTLLEVLASRGYRTAVAVMTLPNPASEGLHRSLGFAEVGTFRSVGWKLGSWHDVLWVQRRLGETGGGGPPREPH